MEQQERRTRFVDVRHPATGRLLLRYCPERDIIQVKRSGEKPVLVNLSEYRRDVPASRDR